MTSTTSLHAESPGPPPIVVLGLGLIGGSLLRAAGPYGGGSGWSPTAATRESVAADGFRVHERLEDALEAAVARDALVVLAAPIPALDGLAKAVGERAPEARVTDVASVKAPIADLMAKSAPAARYIGSHPMAGTAQSGWAAGSADLFRGAAWVTCLTEDSDVETWADVATLGLTVGSRIVPCEPAAHDAAVARISHLPHLLALALAQIGADGAPLAMTLAASSFGDATRVAGTRPELIRAMCEANRPALVEATDEALGILGVARGSLASSGSLAKLTEAGHSGRLAFDRRGAGMAEFILAGDLIDQLISVGASGGHVTSIDRAGGEMKVTAWFPAELD